MKFHFSIFALSSLLTLHRGLAEVTDIALTSVWTSIPPVPTQSIYAFGKVSDSNSKCLNIPSCVSLIAYQQACYQELRQDDSHDADNDKFYQCMCENTKTVEAIYDCASCYIEGFPSSTVDFFEFEAYYCKKQCLSESDIMNLGYDCTAIKTSTTSEVESKSTDVGVQTHSYSPIVTSEVTVTKVGTGLELVTTSSEPSFITTPTKVSLITVTITIMPSTSSTPTSSVDAFLQSIVTTSQPETTSPALDTKDTLSSSTRIVKTTTTTTSSSVVKDTTSENWATFTWTATTPPHDVTLNQANGVLTVPTASLLTLLIGAIFFQF